MTVFGDGSFREVVKVELSHKHGTSINRTSVLVRKGGEAKRGHTCKPSTQKMGEENQKFKARLHNETLPKKGRKEGPDISILDLYVHGGKAV
jgi:hypothetical protein